MRITFHLELNRYPPGLIKINLIGQSPAYWFSTTKKMSMPEKRSEVAKQTFTEDLTLWPSSENEHWLKIDIEILIDDITRYFVLGKGFIKYQWVK